MSGTGGGDSGVETECEAESNDSFMSALSVSDNSNMAAPALPPSLPPHPPHQEDGYLGDCSSDGGNEKNFPIPPDYKYLQSNVLKTSSRDGGESGRVVEPEESDEGGGGIEAPAGLAFRNIRPSSISHFLSENSQKFRPQLPSNSCGYEVGFTV